MKKHLTINLLTLLTFGTLSFNVNADTWNKAVEHGLTQTVNKGIDEFAQNVNNSIEQVSAKKENYLKAVNTNVKNAFQQGYKSEEMKIAEYKKLEEKANDTPRQRGEVVEVSMGVVNPLIKNKKDKQWLNNWAYILEDVGVTQEKTYFEASRLTKKEFEDWANETLQKFK